MFSTGLIIDFLQNFCFPDFLSYLPQLLVLVSGNANFEVPCLTYASPKVK